MKDQYVAPELKLVGDAQEVVLGLYGIGNDFRNEVLVPLMEFAED